MAMAIAVTTKVTNPSTNTRIRVRKLRKIGALMSILHFKSDWQSPLSDRRRPVTHVALSRWVITTCFTLANLGLMPAGAADISVTVVDRDGHGIADVAVTATPTRRSGAGSSNEARTAVMDQSNLTFTPRLLVIATGTSVAFPNSDTVSHQVYSFSPAKRFQLPLYKGQAHPPVIFDRAGLVVLGCNIHDVMVGYIYVTDAPYFGKTDSNGNFAVTNAPDGEYQIGIWSPYITDSAATLERTIHIKADEPGTLRIQLTQKLRSKPQPQPRRRDWEY
jgi:plastocyanin